MKRIVLLLAAVFVATLILTPNTVFSQENNYQLKPEKSKIEWLGKKVTGEHSGTIFMKQGNLTFDADQLLGGSFVVDMTTIVNTDIEDETYRAKLEGHLKSDDFFGVDKFQESKFKITSAEKLADGKFKVIGNLTIKGITEIAELMVNVHKHGKMLHVNGKMIIDRTKYNVRYGSGSFFDNLGDKTIYDEFQLDLDLNFE
ncbi:YceI family protein [Labilibaculum sp.]|uniref:YceI family protein n=1 Tax=Labilibaculum sp. TaxID=2060723 RepID=UPI003563A8DA